MDVIRKNAPRYCRARKKKPRILDEFSAILHFNRKYLALLLRGDGRTVFSHYGTRVIADPRVSFASCRGAVVLSQKGVRRGAKNRGCTLGCRRPFLLSGKALHVGISSYPMITHVIGRRDPGCPAKLLTCHSLFGF